MCGIFAYKGTGIACDFLIDGLKNLEYRGYDSAGVSLISDDGEIYVEKAIGKVSNLASKIENDKKDLSKYHVGIAHTRWATHGGVTLENTHPHHSQNGRFFLVHNGIIENYIDLKKELTQVGYKFYGNTDSEIVANLIEYTFEKDLETTMKKVKELITGAYALVVIDKQNPNQIIAIKLGSPLVIGISADNLFLSSDANALSNITQKYIPIDDNEMVIIDKNNYKIINNQKEIEKDSFESIKNTTQNDMGDFKHFMLKEIFEVPNIIENILGGRINFQNYEIKSNSLDKLDLPNIKKIEIIASGTSYNAGMIGTYLFEDLADIPSQIHISTEFKYKKQFINDKTLYIFISQSGETADSLECLKMVKNRGGKTFGIVNVVGSSIARLCDNGLYTHCGVEIGVASTKAFIGQLLTLIIIALYIGNKNNLDYTKYKKIIDGLAKLKDDINMVLLNSHKVEEIAIKYANFKNMFFLGRNMFYPLAMEGSLKCKEITYNHTESYSAGELKHGPLSLIQEDFPTILLNPESKLYEKNISTLKEVQARNGKVIGILSQNDEHKLEYFDTIEVPKSNEYNSLFTIGVVLQLFAYYMANNLGREIDKPRNLAKSVTVE
ncbi:MAG: glutamine--fructose-6-phosphate transaminase (isomerizing) [Candidatus Gracilibacteria bacterium]|nr:glutamine--fructose-6-phosphate transaminase (isomerizing) [Candidatus Gracilibacteria bacterium]